MLKNREINGMEELGLITPTLCLLIFSRMNISDFAKICHVHLNHCQRNSDTCQIWTHVIRKKCFNYSEKQMKTDNGGNWLCNPPTLVGRMLSGRPQLTNLITASCGNKFSKTWHIYTASCTSCGVWLVIQPIEYAKAFVLLHFYIDGLVQDSSNSTANALERKGKELTLFNDDTCPSGHAVWH